MLCTHARGIAKARAAQRVDIRERGPLNHVGRAQHFRIGQKHGDVIRRLAGCVIKLQLHSRDGHIEPIAKRFRRGDEGGGARRIQRPQPEIHPLALIGAHSRAERIGTTHAQDRANQRALRDVIFEQRFVRVDRDVGRIHECLDAVNVIGMKVRVHDRGHRFWRDLAKILAHLFGRFDRRQRVDDDHAAITFDQNRVAERVSHRGPHIRGDVIDLLFE